MDKNIAGDNVLHIKNGNVLLAVTGKLY